uniref:hypothetical protein n=1 Tax=Petrachloros mirabilis TaxID=2918835 RepID=UPI001EE95F1D|nr:hypothetical protein [Petrachloros mirabilis]
MMSVNLQTLVTILTALLVFATGILLRYDQIQLRQYTFPIPPWVGLSLAAVTFFLVAVDQVLRGLVRLEEIQRRAEEAERRAKESECASRRARIQARCSAAQIRFQLDPSPTHQQQLSAVLTFLEEYGDTL